MTISKTERDALLTKLARLPLAMIGHTGTSVAIEQLAEVVREILEGLGVEETPTCQKRDPNASPQPDFASMGGKFADDLSRAIAATPDLVMQPFVEQWLRDNLPKPPPDVEALIAAVRKATAGGTVGWSDAVRAVAKQVGIR